MGLRNTVCRIVLGLVVAVSAVLVSGVARAEPLCRMNGREVPCGELNAHLGKFVWAGLGLASVLAVLGLFSFVFWIMMIVHVARHDVKDKTMWIVLLVFTGLIGALIYYFVGRREYERSRSRRADA